VWQLHDTFAGGGRVPVGGGVQGVEDEGWGKELRSFLGMVGGAVVFCEVVAMAGRVLVPVVIELILLAAVAEPPKTHFHGFCALGQYSVGHNTQGSAIVGLDWGGGLFVAQFVEEGWTWHGFAHI
jgi:hypothetical protein